MAIFMTARFSVKPEAVEKCQQITHELIDHVTRNEPETYMYIALHEAGDEARFLHILVFEDRAARDRHTRSKAVRQFTSELYPELLAPVEFTEYGLVASTEE